jgi:hypothetical protein
VCDDAAMRTELTHRKEQEHRDGMAAGAADAAAGVPNRLGVKDDLTRFTESDAWCRGYDNGFRWKAYGPGRFCD